MLVALATNKLPEAFVSVSVCTLVKPVIVVLRVTFTLSVVTAVVKFVPPVTETLSPKPITVSVELSSTSVKDVALKSVPLPR